MSKDKDTGTLATHAYTYEVVMIIQVFAENEKEAKNKLDNQGGYVTSRKVILKDSILLFNGKDKEN